MNRVKPALKVVDGKPSAGKTPLEAAYEHFRLDRMGNRASPNTLAHYDAMLRPFLAWAIEEGVRRFEDLGVERLGHAVGRPPRHGALNLFPALYPSLPPLVWERPRAARFLCCTTGWQGQKPDVPAALAGG
jgi:hypothetical protein